MEHLTAKKLPPRPVALWHHSFCSNFWCNQTAWSKAELTEVLALRSTEHFKAKGWNPGHAEVNGNFATNFNETRISPREFSKCHFSASTLIIRIVCCGEQRQCKRREGGKRLGNRAKGKYMRSPSRLRKQERTGQNCKDSDNKCRERERRKQKHTKNNSKIRNYLRLFLDGLSWGSSQNWV